MKNRVIFPVKREDYKINQIGEDIFIEAALGSVKISFPLIGAPIPTGLVRLVLEYETPDANP